MNAYRILAGKPKGNRLLTTPGRGWEGNIKMRLSEIRLEGVDWINLDQQRQRWLALVNAILNPEVPYTSGNFLTSSAYLTFQGREC
jgi:hypothetical protein